MIYSSLTFVFFGILILLVFYFLPKRFRIFWLCVASFAWYSTWKWQWAAILFGILAINYIGLCWIRARALETRKRPLTGLLLINIAVFIFLKVGKVGSWQFDTPYGTSFFMFMIFAYIVDLLRAGVTGPIEKAQSFFLMPSFFPLLVGGPIERARHFFPQLKDGLEFRYDNVVDGILIFAYGFTKKNCLGLGLSSLNWDLQHFAELNPFLFIFVGLLKTFHAYIDFSSYCDMGRGVAKCFGIDLTINFRPIIFSKNPNDFWQRWNITLGTWIRDYISFPMMLNWGRVINHNVILFCSFVVVGLWHGFTLNWLAFGIFNGVMIILFNWTQRKIKIGKLGYLFTFVIFVGNGLFQQSEVLEAIVASVKQFDSAHFPLVYELRTSTSSKLTPVFFSALAGVFIMDILQELKKDVDWYTKIPKYLKVSLVAIIVGTFLLAMDIGKLTDVNEPPPVYFKI